MKAYYDLLDAIELHLTADDIVNSVSSGTIYDVDLQKQTMFPLSHLMVNSATHEGNILRFNITVLAMDQLDISKEEDQNLIKGNDNDQDIFNTQLAVLVRMIDMIRKSSTAKTYNVDGNPEFEPFNDRFENGLTGWACTFDIIMPNTMNVC